MRRWLPLIAGVLVVAAILLGRLSSEQLFLVPLPVDRQPSISEEWDAKSTAYTWLVPTLLFLFVGGITIALTSRSGPIETGREMARKIRTMSTAHPLLVNLFALTCLLDLYTTWAYAQQFSMADELHPAIRLVMYAFGITVGVVIAKAIQAGLVLIIAALWPKTARTLMLVITGGYAVAAAWNFHWL